MQQPDEEVSIAQYDNILRNRASSFEQLGNRYNEEKQWDAAINAYQEAIKANNERKVANKSEHNDIYYSHLSGAYYFKALDHQTAKRWQAAHEALLKSLEYDTFIKTVEEVDLNNFDTTYRTLYTVCIELFVESLESLKFEEANNYIQCAITSIVKINMRTSKDYKNLIAALRSSGIEKPIDQPSAIIFSGASSLDAVLFRLYITWNKVMQKGRKEKAYLLTLLEIIVKDYAHKAFPEGPFKQYLLKDPANIKNFEAKISELKLALQEPNSLKLTTQSQVLAKDSPLNSGSTSQQSQSLVSTTQLEPERPLSAGP